MAARNVNLTDRLAAFVDEQVRNGRHQNASEVVREALRRYEAALAAERDAMGMVRAALRKAIHRSETGADIRPELLETALAEMAEASPAGPGA
ncbi:type II toxin-antitoxin system ParD family antitoxin [Muricoccus pecuniae]|uniref:Antitoxin ParD1/3/4 n=1 Tax=Muricoccus pecuniae TaxID=693023 RepID=A0A840Y2J2_9PROT|nr:type II toxin-antitoxin system ParD family antitoxin [Roseomonas pecuniae]MBB5693870.1 antitoxin ParD1/3/4 [Roseomonas pecuniae]